MLDKRQHWWDTNLQTQVLGGLDKPVIKPSTSQLLFMKLKNNKKSQLVLRSHIDFLVAQNGNMFPLGLEDK